MPLFYQQDIDDTTRLAVWEIREEEAFFTQYVPLQRTITHPHKRLQHLAGRYLLQYLFPDFPIALIQIADTRKPFLENEAYHFSISHCGSFAAVIASRQRRVGIDIEAIGPKVARIRHKFVSEAEEAWLQPLLTEHPYEASFLLTLLWSAKEAVFKWYGNGELDFRQHMQVRAPLGGQNGPQAFLLCFLKASQQEIELKAHCFQDLVLSYVAT